MIQTNELPEEVKKRFDDAFNFALVDVPDINGEHGGPLNDEIKNFLAQELTAQKEELLKEPYAMTVARSEALNTLANTRVKKERLALAAEIEKLLIPKGGSHFESTTMHHVYNLAIQDVLALFKGHTDHD